MHSGLRAIVMAVLVVALALPAMAQRGNPGPATDPDLDDIVVKGERGRARPQWVRVDSDNFTLFARDEGDARAMAVKLERFHQLLGILTQTGPTGLPTPLPVYMVFGEGQLGRLRLNRLPPGHFATGYYSAAPTGMLAAANTALDAKHVRVPRFADVWLFTEYTRHYLIQNARGAYLPAWYVDGLSLFLSTTQFDGDKVLLGKAEPNLILLLTYEKWEPLDRIIAGDVVQGQIYSGEAMLLVNYILASRQRVKAFDTFINAVRNGADRVPAFEAAFGAKVGKVQSAMFDHLQHLKATGATMTNFAPANLTATMLPPSANALLLDDAAMQIGVPEEHRQRALLDRVEHVAVDRTDRYAQRVLARAEILYGAPDKADAPLDILLAKAPSDPELLYLKGMRHLMAGRADAAAAPAHFAEARQWFARAYRVDPDYYPALYGWAESLSTEPQFVSENTINVLVKAAQSAPQVTQLWVTAAIMMMADGRFEAAELLLAPRAISPRDPASEQIPALLAQAKAGQRADKAQILASFRYTADWRDVNCC